MIRAKDGFVVVDEPTFRLIASIVESYAIGHAKTTEVKAPEIADLASGMWTAVGDGEAASRCTRIAAKIEAAREAAPKKRSWW